MALNQSQRPQFYEGQYLGAADLNSVVEHTRNLQARHGLGTHTWGIAIGLELKEVTQPGTNQLGIYLQPGFAWDGFGRQIVVLEPTPIPATLFESFRHISSDEPKGRLVEVWLRYKEDQTQPPRDGFEVCDVQDQYARWQESFSVEVGPRPVHADRHNPLSVGGRSVDAEQALQTFDAADPLVRDESIPFQIFPQSGQFDRWLIPLGKVRWHPSAVSTQPGKFEARDDDDKAKSRLLRRYVGLVAEEIHAPAGFLRVRDRTQPYNDSEARTDDLLWVDGKLRAGGDVRLFGSLLSLLNSDGDDEGVPLLIQRGERTAVGGKALQIQIGTAKDGKNALEVGPADTSGAFTAKLVVLDNGNVGIGTSQPTSTLEVSGGETLLRGGDLVLKATAEDPGDVIFQNSAGNQKGRIWSNPMAGAALHLSSGDNSSDLTIDSAGNVGIGTTTPAVRLDVADGGMFMRHPVAGGNTSRALEIGSQSPVAAGVPNGRIGFPGYGVRHGQFRWVPGAGTDGRFELVDASASSPSGDYGAAPTYVSLRALNGIFLGNLSIGTASVSERLVVNGNILLGATSNLFALGSLVNLRLVAGRVNAGGSIASGSGFTVVRNSVGRYTVTFTPGFSGTPIVVASAFELSSNDNLVAVENINSLNFQLFAKDTTPPGSDEGQLQDTAFTFIAVGSP